MMRRESNNSDTGMAIHDSDSLNERLDGKALPRGWSTMFVFKGVRVVLTACNRQ